MKFNKLKYKDLTNLLDFTLDYFKQDVNYKINEGIMQGELIKSISYTSKDEELNIMEGIIINDVEILFVAYGKLYFKNNPEVKYEDIKFRELMTYISIWGLQTIYEESYLKVPKLSSQQEFGWGISPIK